jgi:hypothetical protein
VPGGAATGSSRAAAPSRSSADRDPAAIELSAGAMGRPGPQLDERIEQLAELGVTHVVVGAARPDQLASIGADLVARHG